MDSKHVPTNSTTLNNMIQILLKFRKVEHPVSLPRENLTLEEFLKQPVFGKLKEQHQVEQMRLYFKKPGNESSYVRDTKTLWDCIDFFESTNSPVKITVQKVARLGPKPPATESQPESQPQTQTQTQTQTQPQPQTEVQPQPQSHALASDGHEQLHDQNRRRRPVGSTLFGSTEDPQKDRNINPGRNVFSSTDASNSEDNMPCTIWPSDPHVLDDDRDNESLDPITQIIKIAQKLEAMGRHGSAPVPNSNPNPNPPNSTPDTSQILLDMARTLQRAATQLEQKSSFGWESKNFYSGGMDTYMRGTHGPELGDEEPLDAEMQDKLHQIESAGYKNRELNLQVLKVFDGNVDTALEELLRFYSGYTIQN